MVVPLCHAFSNAIDDPPRHHFDSRYRLNGEGCDAMVRSWIFNLQPSEFAKFTMMLFLALRTSFVGREVRRQFSGFVKPMAVVGLIAVLLLMEPDYGTLLVLSCAVMGVLLLAGAPFTQYLVFGSALALGLVFLAVIEPYRFEKLKRFSTLGRSIRRWLPADSSTSRIWSRRIVWDGSGNSSSKSSFTCQRRIPTLYSRS